MTTMLGKRKRKEEVSNQRKKEEAPVKQSEEEIDAQEIFRKHFEAQFKPLPEVKRMPKVEEPEDDEDDDDDDDDDWDGISEEEDTTTVEIIEHTNSPPKALHLMSKEELRRFMTSKPPTAPPPSVSLAALKSSKATDDDPAEATNLKNDLALQRLLTESHLLDSASSTGPTGSNRHKATDLRLQALGAKTSILTQKSMPQAMRKGIIAKAEQKEETRRKQARENGVILEVAQKKKRNGTSGGSMSDKGKRDRGIGAPGVGRFKGGTLSLSKNDVRAIEGPRSSSRGGRGIRGGRGRGRGKR